MKRAEYSNCVEIPVNILRNRVDLGVELIFNGEHASLVLLSHEVDSQTEMPKSS